MTSDFIAMQLLLKDEGYQYTMMPTKLIGELASRIRSDGSVPLHTTGGDYDVVGFMVYGKEVGERVIVIDPTGDRTTETSRAKL